MNEKLAALVHELRVSHSLTETELGQLLGLSRSSIVRIERGDKQLTATELVSLASLFGGALTIGIEKFLSDVMADLATRLRIFLENMPGGADQPQKADWLHDTLFRLDHTYVGDGGSA